MKIKAGHAGQGTNSEIQHIVSAQAMLGIIMLNTDDSPKEEKQQKQDKFD